MRFRRHYHSVHDEDGPLEAASAPELPWQNQELAAAAPRPARAANKDRAGLAPAAGDADGDGWMEGSRARVHRAAFSAHWAIVCRQGLVRLWMVTESGVQHCDASPLAPIANLSNVCGVAFVPGPGGGGGAAGASSSTTTTAVCVGQNTEGECEIVCVPLAAAGVGSVERTRAANIRERVEAVAVSEHGVAVSVQTGGVWYVPLHGQDPGDAPAPDQQGGRPLVDVGVVRSVAAQCVVEGNAVALTALAFGSGGQQSLLVAGTRAGFLEAYVAPESWRGEWKKIHSCERAHHGKIQAVAFSPDSTQFATVSVDRCIKLWTAPGCECIRRIELAHSGSITAVGYLPTRNGAYGVVTASDDRRVKTWSVAKGECLSCVEAAHNTNIDALVINPNGTGMLTTGADGSVRVWTTKLHSHIDKPSSMLPCHITAIRTDGSASTPEHVFVLLVDGCINRVRIRDWTSVEQVTTRATAMSVSKDGRRIYFGTSTGHVVSRDVAKFQEAERPAHSSAVVSVASVERGDGLEFVASGGLDGHVRMWEVEQGTLEMVPFEYGVRSGHSPYAALALAFSDSGQILVAGRKRGEVEIFRVDKTKASRHLVSAAKSTERNHHNMDVRCLAFAPQANEDSICTFVSGSSDRSIRAWRVTGMGTGINLELVFGHTNAHLGGVQGLSFCGKPGSDKGFLFSAGDFDGLYAWGMSADGLQCLLHIDDPCGAVTSFGSTLLSSHKSELVEWDWEHLLSLPDKLQPTHGAYVGRPQAVVVRLPCDTRAGANSDKRQGRTVQHLALCKPVDSKWLYETGLVRCILSSPWLCGVIVFLASVHKEYALLQDVVHRVLRCGGTLSLGPDKVTAWQSSHNPKLDCFGLSTCGYARAIVDRKFPVVETLTEAVIETWTAKEHTQILHAGHLCLLLRTFPALALRLLSEAPGHSDALPFVIRAQPLVVAGDLVRTELPASDRLVRRSEGVLPHDFWPEVCRNNISWWGTLKRWAAVQDKWGTLKRWAAVQDSPSHETDIAAHHIGVEGLVTHSRDFLEASVRLGDSTIAEKLFSSEMVTATVEWAWQQQQWSVRCDFVISVVQLCSFFLASALAPSPTLFVTQVLWLCLLSTTIWCSLVEGAWLKRVGFAYFVDIFNLFNCVCVLTTVAVMVLLFVRSDKVHVTAAIAMLMGWIKIVFFLRVFGPTSFLISALAQIARDMAAFLCVMAITVLGFAASFFVIFDNMLVPQGTPRSLTSTDKGASAMGGTLHGTVVFMISAMLGEFDAGPFSDAPQYSTLLTALFYVYMLFVFVIMLNVAIAIIGDSFDRVQSRQEMEHKRQCAQALVRLPARLTDEDRKFGGWLQLLRPVAVGLRGKEAEAGAVPEAKWHGKVAQITRNVKELLRAHEARTTTSHTTSPVEGTEPEALAWPPRAEVLPPPGGRQRLRSNAGFRSAASKLRIKKLALLPADVQIKIVSKTSRHYEVVLRDENARRQMEWLKKKGVLFRGEFSPVSKVTLDSHARKDARIPDTATEFVFAFPLKGVEFLNEEDKTLLPLADASLNFIFRGGFVYFDSDDQVIRVNALLSNITTNGPGVCLGKPLKFHAQNAASLHDQRRLQPVTIPPLRRKGIMFYAWILPHEKLDGYDAPFQHGAFLYKYDEDPLEVNDEDCVLPVVCGGPCCADAQ